jgi:hypothetical protein
MAEAELQEIRIRISLPFENRKGSHAGSAAGMGPEAHRAWRSVLEREVLRHQSLLRQWVEARTRLEARLVIAGPKRQIDPLDVHDALSQLLDEVTAVTFPRPPESRAPQRQDEQYWRVSAEKVVAEAGRVEIVISPVGPELEVLPGAAASADEVTEGDARDGFYRDLLSAGLLAGGASPRAAVPRERTLAPIQGDPLSQTIIDERR